MAMFYDRGADDLLRPLGNPDVPGLTLEEAKAKHPDERVWVFDDDLDRVFGRTKEAS